MPKHDQRSGALHTVQTNVRRERRRIQYNWSNGNPKFMGYHTDIDAAETDIDWEITKYTSDVLEDEGPRYGPVNDEAVLLAMAWNI